MIWETHPFQKYVVSSVPNMPKVLTLSLKIRSPETVRTEGSNNNNGVCFPKNLSYPAALSFAQNYIWKQALKVEQFQFT
jgi:hypothetical protein